MDVATSKNEERAVTSAAQAIRQELDRRGWSKIQLADHLGCAPQQVGQWSLGERQPSAQWIPELARWLGISARKLHVLVDAQRNPEQRISSLEQRVELLESLLNEIQSHLRSRSS